MFALQYSTVFWRISLLLVGYCQFVLSIPVLQIANARFLPINPTSQITTLFNIQSLDFCICRCYSYSNCILVMHQGGNQSCSLFSTNRTGGNLQLVSTDKLSTVVVFNAMNSTAITTAYTTASTTQTTTQDTCTPPATTLLQYTVTPTSYTKQIYNYTAMYTGMARLEFGFKAKNSQFTWHLDDVSVIDRSALNAEQLGNGGFENSTSTAWQIACSGSNCGGTGGAIVQTSCHTGSSCYEGACRGNYDFLRQSFPVIVNHVYTLSFWLYTDGHNAQAAYVSIT